MSCRIWIFTSVAVDKTEYTNEDWICKGVKHDGTSTISQTRTLERIISCTGTNQSWSNRYPPIIRFATIVVDGGEIYIV
jgi:hypothetical protein